MSHDPLTLFELDMHVRRTRDLRAAYGADLPGSIVGAVKRRIMGVAAPDGHTVPVRSRILPLGAKRLLAVAATALMALFLLGAFSAIPSAPDPQGSGGICAEREVAVMKAVESRAGVPDANDILGRARTTMLTARNRCAQGKITQAVTLYNYILRRVTTLPAAPARNQASIR
jgi:hypothetical protein